MLKKAFLTCIVALLALIPASAFAQEPGTDDDDGLLLRINGDVRVAEGETESNVVVIRGDLVVEERRDAGDERSAPVAGERRPGPPRAEQEVEADRRLRREARQQLELRDDTAGNAEVTDREFRGHDVLYRVRHETGRSLIVQLPSLELFEVGQRVFVRPARQAVAPPVD